LYAELGILKFFDLVKTLNIPYVHKYLNGNLPSDSLETLEFNKLNHSIGTRGNTAGLLSRQNVNTTNFGLHSLTRIAADQWNFLQESFPNLNLSELKSLLHSFFINKYSLVE